MAFEFNETLTISVPNIEEQLSAFSESEYKSNHNLIIEVAAIHEGMTANFNYYPAEALAESVESWTNPYPKPIIMNHDPYSEPVGRVMAAKMDQEADGTPYVRLQVAVTDPEAVRKVMDQRYLTGSVGGKAEEAICNICGADWAKASMMSMPCRHQRGTPYKGKVAHVEMKKIQFKEYSFVNMPADARSSVRQLATNATGESTEDDGWIRPAEIFSIDMNKEEILELSESNTRNILEGMSKKKSSPIYHEYRGAFLSAIAIAEAEDTTKESIVAKETELIEEEEDILAVADELSSDLAATEAEEVEEETEDEETPEESDTSEPEDTEAPEAQEDPHEDDDEDTTDDPESRESDDVTDEVTEEEAPTEEEADDSNSETELNERVLALESRVEELETREQTLLGENAKLKNALKRTLAERVVDTKIALGLHETAERETLLEDHVNRSASSLADSLRDLAKMPFKTREAAYIPTMTERSAAVEGEENVVTEEVEEEAHNTPSPEEQLENILVDTLMNRRRL